MADVAWTTVEGGSGVKYHEVTITGANNTTEIIAVDPDKELSLIMKYDTESDGNADSLSIEISTANVPATANMMEDITGIVADKSDVPEGPISGMRFVSNGADTHSIYLVEAYRNSR